ncbi:ATP-binding protein [Bdellovibrio bacteriovorus]|uniref:sensor histidine kinase n=1 Tax=Bdellovibrio bacteriovorus TaxID=959 RepID=UPI0021D37C07|nr:ATP-binding protein [Bdellovibrio bacteriovorus]UXR63390.1 ATP-binding protein [Bdellovibrio bacteriovorus]
MTALREIKPSEGCRFIDLGSGYGRVVVSTDFQILSNPLHLEQVIENLVVNALKHTSDLVSITVKDSVIEVQDQGDGIPAEVVERLGTPFNRGPHRSGREKGSGLGLAWVQSVVVLYSWNFELRSSAGRGACAVLKFPAFES